MTHRLRRVSARPLPAFKDYVEVLAKWLHELDAWALAITFTIKRHDHRGRPVNQHVVNKTIRHFVNTLNQGCFGRSKADKGFTVGFAAAYGWGIYDDHPHVHISVTTPKHIAIEMFYDLIDKASKACHWIDKHRKIERYRDMGWMRYLVHHGADQVLVELVRPAHPA